MNRHGKMLFLPEVESLQGPFFSKLKEGFPELFSTFRIVLPENGMYQRMGIDEGERNRRKKLFVFEAKSPKKSLKRPFNDLGKGGD